MGAKCSFSNVVVIGAWNPAILTPDWLSRNKVVGEGPKELVIGWGVPMNRITFEVEGATFFVDAARLEIRATGMNDCGRFVVRILGLLPHTPVVAIGVNFVFEIPVEEWPPQKLPALGDIDFKSKSVPADLEQVQSAVVRKLDE